MMDGMTLMLLWYVENWGIHMEMQQDKLSLDQVLVLCGYTKLAVWEMRVNYHTVYTLGLETQEDAHIQEMLECSVLKETVRKLPV